MSLPVVTVEVGFSVGASTGTYLHLDDTARGKLDTGTLAPDEVWTDVTDYVLKWKVNRGSTRADSPLLRYDTGTASITLDNSDRRFDPSNLSGPYVAAGASQVTPMVAVRIRATWAGVTYDLFRGFADEWGISWVGPYVSEAVLTASDAFKVLASYERPAVAAVGAGENTGARISRILDSVGWPAADRVIATGNSTLQATTLEGGALAELQLATESEIGELYIDGAGRVVFRNRLAILTESRSNTNQGTFGNAGGGELPYWKLGLSNDDSTFFNLVRANRAGGTEQSAEDAASRTKYLTKTFSKTDLLLETDAVVLTYAQWILHISKTPELRFTSLTLTPQRDETNLFPQALGRQLGDRITVKVRPPGGGTITRDVFLRGIEHSSAPQSAWETTWVLQSASKYGSFLTLNNSTLGTLDSGNALAY